MPPAASPKCMYCDAPLSEKQAVQGFEFCNLEHEEAYYVLRRLGVAPKMWRREEKSLQPVATKPSRALKAPANEPGACRHCGQPLPLISRLRRGQFCSSDHEQEFEKKQSDRFIDRVRGFAGGGAGSIHSKKNTAVKIRSNKSPRPSAPCIDLTAVLPAQEWNLHDMRGCFLGRLSVFTPEARFSQGSTGLTMALPVVVRQRWSLSESGWSDALCNLASPRPALARTRHELTDGRVACPLLWADRSFTESRAANTDLLLASDELDLPDYSPPASGFALCGEPRHGSPLPPRAIADPQDVGTALCVSACTLKFCSYDKSASMFALAYGAVLDGPLPERSAPEPRSGAAPWRERADALIQNNRRESALNFRLTGTAYREGPSPLRADSPRIAIPATMMNESSGLKLIGTFEGPLPEASVRADALMSCRLTGTAHREGPLPLRAGSPRTAIPAAMMHESSGLKLIGTFEGPLPERPARADALMYFRPTGTAYREGLLPARADTQRTAIRAAMMHESLRLEFIATCTSGTQYFTIGTAAPLSVLPVRKSAGRETLAAHWLGGQPMTMIAPRGESRPARAFHCWIALEEPPPARAQTEPAPMTAAWRHLAPAPGLAEYYGSRAGFALSPVADFARQLPGKAADIRRLPEVWRHQPHHVQHPRCGVQPSRLVMRADLAWRDTALHGKRELFDTRPAAWREGLTRPHLISESKLQHRGELGRRPPVEFRVHAMAHEAPRVWRGPDRLRLLAMPIWWPQKSSSRRRTQSSAPI